MFKNYNILLKKLIEAELTWTWYSKAEDFLAGYQVTICWYRYLDAEGQKL